MAVGTWQIVFIAAKRSSTYIPPFLQIFIKETRMNRFEEFKRFSSLMDAHCAEIQAMVSSFETKKRPYAEKADPEHVEVFDTGTSHKQDQKPLFFLRLFSLVHRFSCAIQLELHLVPRKAFSFQGMLVFPCKKPSSNNSHRPFRAILSYQNHPYKPLSL